MFKSSIEDIALWIGDLGNEKNTKGMIRDKEPDGI